MQISAKIRPFTNKFTYTRILFLAQKTTILALYSYNLVKILALCSYQELSSKFYPTHQINEQFRKREFVVEFVENPQYPQYLTFQLTQERCDIMNHFQSGQRVEVDYNLRGRRVVLEDEVRYFTFLQAWRVKLVEKAPDVPNGKQVVVS